MKAWGAVALVLALWVAGRMASLSVGTLQHLLDGTLAAVLLFTALRFEREDPPRRAWGAAGLAQVIATVVHLGQAGFLGEGTGWVGPAVLVMNVFWVSAIAIFVRNVATSGLAPAWTMAHRVWVGLACAAAAAGLVLVLREEFANMQAQGLSWSQEATHLISALADTSVFVGAVFLIRMTAPMAGGRVARPYFLLCFSAAAYLIVDVLLATADADAYAALDVGSQVWVALADGALLTAALAQIELLREHA